MRNFYVTKQDLRYEKKKRLKVEERETCSMKRARGLLGWGKGVRCAHISEEGGSETAGCQHSSPSGGREAASVVAMAGSAGRLTRKSPGPAGCKAHGRAGRRSVDDHEEGPPTCCTRTVGALTAALA